MMNKAYYIRLISYAPLLQRLGIAFQEDDKTLMVGEAAPGDGFVLFISCKTLKTPELLQVVLPFLKNCGAAFRLIKNQQLQYRLNAGDFGEATAGKVISIFADDAEILTKLAAGLDGLTSKFKGPVIVGAQRIGEVLYVQVAARHSGSLQLSMPRLKKLPFAVPERFRRKVKRHAILGKYYLPVGSLRSSPKGQIYKAINLRKMAFNWCLIKQGNPVALDDHFDRDMRDRLRWQHTVITRLGSQVRTPQVIDYFEQQDSTYLVLEYVEGESLGRIVRRMLSGISWKQLERPQQVKLLEWYAKAVALVEAIHQQGFVHRDVTDSNLLVMPDEALCIIDFELAYSLTDQLPDPPFLLGTFGYAAPEQLQYASPSPKEDIYSLGALLCFMLSGCAPHEFLQGGLKTIRKKLYRLSAEPGLADLAVRCLQEQQKNRPAIGELKKAIQLFTSTLNISHDEKTTMGY